MDRESNGRWLLRSGGICGILYPVLDLSFFAVYPLAAGGPILSGGGQEAYMVRLAALGERPWVLALEWVHTLLPMQLLPFALGLYRLLTARGQRSLAQLALVTFVLSLAITLPSNAMTATLNHDLGRSYVEAESVAERTAIFAAFRGLGAWHGGLNEMASVLFQTFVGLSGLSMVRSSKYRVRGWIGVAGSVMALVKLTPGLPGMTNFLWTGLAYAIWPIAVGIGLLREPRQAEK
jgi:uncharacterized membrane protein YhaH (DUF805 family)